MQDTGERTKPGTLGSEGEGEGGSKARVKSQMGHKQGRWGEGSIFEYCSNKSNTRLCFFICINSDHSCKACKDLEVIFEEIIKKSTKCFA